MLFGLTPEENRQLRRLRTPQRVQDFVEELRLPFAQRGSRCRSPRLVLREKVAFCMEGAMAAAVALRMQGQKPLVLDLTAAAHDDDHVVALFRVGRYWGAVSKTNHAVLRYRDPIYRSVRELAVSYFHEYFDRRGRKTLRSWAVADLSRFDRRGWMTSEEDVWYVPEHLADIAHRKFLTRAQRARLRPVDRIEKIAGDITTWTRQGRTVL